eukprot:236732-Alexandrium_andersonii.AAC.1
MDLRPLGKGRVAAERPIALEVAGNARNRRAFVLVNKEGLPPALEGFEAALGADHHALPCIDDD